MSAESFRVETKAQDETTRIRENVRLFFSTWAKKHADEIENTGFSEFNPAQDPDVPMTEASMPADDETLEEFADRIQNVVSMSFPDPEAAGVFLESLDRPYPYEGGNGRTILEVLEQDYLSRGKGVVPILAHVDKGLEDVPRVTGLIRSNLIKRYGAKYLDSVGEVASKTIAFETTYGADAPDVLSILGRTIYVAPTTGSVEEILIRSGLTQEDYDDVAKHVNNLGARPIARLLRQKDADETGETEPGQVVVISATGKRADLSQDQAGNVTAVMLDAVETNSARLISFGSAFWPISVAQNKIEFGPIIPIDKQRSTGLSKEDQHAAILAQIEDGMDIIAALTDKIVAPGRPAVSIYQRATPRTKVPFLRTETAA